MLCTFNLYLHIGLVESSSSSTVMINCTYQRQQNILVESQSSNCVTISYTHTNTTPVTTLSVVECLTTSCSVVTSISGQDMSTAITTAGMFYMLLH